MNQPSINEVLHEQTSRLMAIPGVVGVGIGMRGDLPCITVFVIQSAVKDNLPSSLQGYPVSVEETGRFQSQE